MEALRKWPRGTAAKFLLLPGGFLKVPWLTCSWSGSFGWNSDATDFELLKQHVEPYVEALVDAGVQQLARGKMCAIAFGIDVGPDTKTGASAELAVMYDLAKPACHITGKSFPRGDQRRVVRIKDVKSHFVKVSGERVLVLGCHDLNLFSPRGRSRQLPDGPLAALRREMDREVGRFAPTVALQLPHGTDTPRTWTLAWNALAASAGLHAWASGVAYYRAGEGGERSSFKDVCAKTFGGAPCLDLFT